MRIGPCAAGQQINLGATFINSGRQKGDMSIFHTGNTHLCNYLWTSLFFWRFQLGACESIHMCVWRENWNNCAKYVRRHHTKFTMAGGGGWTPKQTLPLLGMSWPGGCYRMDIPFKFSCPQVTYFEVPLFYSVSWNIQNGSCLKVFLQINV